MLEMVSRKGNILHCGWERKLLQPVWKTLCRSLKKLEIGLPYDSDFSFLTINAENNKNTNLKRYAAKTYTRLGRQTLGGHKQNLVCARTQEKGAVTAQETDPDLP